jgi:hypothetical protein
VRPERIVRCMNDSTLCALCGDEIDVGQAWMEADREGARIRAHAGCVYRDEVDSGESASWEPQEGPPS